MSYRQQSKRARFARQRRQQRAFRACWRFDRPREVMVSVRMPPSGDALLRRAKDEVSADDLVQLPDGRLMSAADAMGLRFGS